MKTIAEIWEHAEKSYAELPAVRWLVKKDINEISYKALGEEISGIRSGRAALGFHDAHIALIGTASVCWIEAYLGITTGNNVAVPLDAGLPEENLIELLQDSDSEALLLSPKLKSLADTFKKECPKIQKIWILEEEAAEAADTLADLMNEGSTDADGRAEEEVATINYTS